VPSVLLLESGEIGLLVCSFFNVGKFRERSHRMVCLVFRCFGVRDHTEWCATFFYVG
jgi:hypothetical protein